MIAQRKKMILLRLSLGFVHCALHWFEACLGTYCNKPLFPLPISSRHISPLSMKPMSKRFDLVNIRCLFCSEASWVALSKANHYEIFLFMALEENPNIFLSILPMSPLSCYRYIIPWTRATHFKSLISPSLDHDMFPSLTPSFDLSP